MENTELKARKFAIEAHKGQVRKSDPIKPMVIHPINVANMLKDYGFDENVIAAGYLHDVVEDTKYTNNDIKKIFGDDVASLVYGASEPDKSLSWEERKQHTINETKELDLRHKAIICCDKISNLEDLRILSEINGEYDFSAFKRGYDSQKWYYEEVYKSLINNEDDSLPMFKKLKEIIDYVFSDEKDNTYIKDKIFEENQEEYYLLKKLHYRKLEIYKLMKTLSNKRPYVIEFTGTPRTGKTSLINNLIDFFSKQGFNVCYLEEFTTSKEYKKNIKPKLKNMYTNIVNQEIPKYVLKYLEEAISNNPDIIIVDRCLFDRLIWVDRLFLKKGIDKEEYETYKEKYIPIIKDKIDIIISTYTDSLTALKRDYNANLSFENRSFLNEINVTEYNNSLNNMIVLGSKEKINIQNFDTTDKTMRKLSFEIVDNILKNMRDYYLEEIKKELELSQGILENAVEKEEKTVNKLVLNKKN